MVRYGYGILAVVVALGAALALRSFDLEGFLFVIAIAVAVWLGGRGPGVAAIVLSVLVLHYVFIAPQHTGAMLTSSGYFVVFSMLAVLITALSESRHRAERSLVQARDELDAEVQARNAELRRSNQQLRDEVAERTRVEATIWKQAALLNLAHDAIIVRDLDSRVTFWNRGAEQTYGWTAEDALGRVTHELLQTTFPVSRDAIEAATRAQGNWEGELGHVTRDGTAIVVASRWSVQRDARGAPIAFLEINRDVTDRKRAEEALRTAQAELAHVTRVTTLGEVTASFAHEVNQPLAAIVNNANACLALLSNGTRDLAEVGDALADILGDAERASAIVERVRALATRSSSGQGPVRLQDVVQGVVALAATESSARRVTIHTDLPADLPVVSGNRVQLQQVMLNLLVNGMDAMSTVHEQERLLEIRGRQDTQDGRPAATISVRDHGIGVKAAQLVAIVDDDASVRQSTCRLIRSLGWRAEAFGSAQEFLDSGRAATIACLILDVCMPGMDGLELQRRLIESGAAIPVVFITARASDEQERRALQAGALAVLRKPVGKEALLRVLGPVLDTSTSVGGDGDDD